MSGGKMETRMLKKRERLIGLKYSVMDGAFSSVFLVLVLVNGAFVLAFARKVLGLSEQWIGFLTSLPFIVNIAQPFITAVATKFGHRKAISVGFSWVVAVIWVVIVWLPLLPLPWVREHLATSFVALAALATLVAAPPAITWMNWISDLVPENVRGRFFGRRNMICGATGLLATLLGGFYLDLFREADTRKLAVAFAAMFSVGFVFRAIGLFYAGRIPDPGTSERGGLGEMARALGGVMRDGNFLTYVAFVSAFNFCMNLAAPFYFLYMTEYLGMAVGTVTLLGCIAGVGAMISFEAWGKLSDRFGHKAVLIASGLMWLTPSLLWLATTPNQWKFLYALFFVGGLTSAGFALSTFNLLLKLVRAEAKTTYISAYVFITSVAAAFAPNLGGWLLGMWKDKTWEILGHTFTGYHLLFAIQLTTAIASFAMLTRLKEPAERRVSEVIGAMRNMREFNPILGFGFMLQRVFTPRGLLGVAKTGARALHETRKVAREVGEDLAEEAEKLVKPPREKEK
jgi:MFS family permease